MEDGAFGKVLAGLASAATVVGTVVAVMAYRDTKQQPVPEEPTASYAEQTAAQTETQTETQTAEMTLSAGTESAAEVQTAAVTDTTAAAAVTEQAAVTGTAASTSAAPPPEKDLTVHADSDFKVKTLAEVQPAAWRYIPSTFFSYDANKGILYFLSDTAHINAYDLSADTVQEIGDFGDRTEAYGLAVNPFTGKLYAAVRSTENQNCVDLYDCTDDRIAAEHIMWDTRTDHSNMILFPNKDTAFISVNTNDYGKYSLKDGTGEYGENALYRDLVSNSYSAVMPFLQDGSYWYLFLWNDTYSGQFKMDAAKTRQILPSASVPLTNLTDWTKGSCGISVDGDGLCYIDPDRNIWEIDPGAERGGGSLLSTPESPDTLLVDGSRIENSASAYISQNVPCFIRIDNSRFVLYDADDSALKLLYTE